MRPGQTREPDPDLDALALRPTEPGCRDFPFRPWVRSTCRKAMLWGIGVVTLLGALVWALRSPGDETSGHAFGVLLAYALLFWASLAKIWWTAGRPAVGLDAEGLYYQPLHTLRPRRVAWGRIVACGPRPGTESLRLVVERNGNGRELFLNLAVVKGRHDFLDLVGARLIERGLVPVAGRGGAWARPGWEEPGTPSAL